MARPFIHGGRGCPVVFPHPLAILTQRTDVDTMADFAKLEAMVDSALPFVRDWASDEHHRAHLKSAWQVVPQSRDICPQISLDR